jgi:hypothetical protein
MFHSRSRYVATSEFSRRTVRREAIDIVVRLVSDLLQMVGPGVKFASLSKEPD